MKISTDLSRLFSSKFLRHLEQKHEIENLGDMVINLDLSTEQGSIGFRDYAPTSEWSSHATEDVYGEVPYDVSVEFADDEVLAKKDLVWELTKAVEEMVKEQDETLINYIND